MGGAITANSLERLVRAEEGTSSPVPSRGALSDRTHTGLGEDARPFVVSKGYGPVGGLAGYRRPYWDTQPPYLYPPYASTVTRSPTQPLVLIPQTLSEVTGPVFGQGDVEEGDNDLTHRFAGEPLGERIVVSGRVMDANGRPVPQTLVEIWQANACGRYRHERDAHDAPLDPNFDGCGRTLTDREGRYQFLTVKPGPYPWRNHHNAWRPAHIHFSLFGPSFVTRLVTQMYFPGDPLLPYDPIFNSTANEVARARLVSALDFERTTPEYALGFRFDIVLRGRSETPLEGDR
ncbi:MAG TPA: protocatechuate 3,4-dioxygenase subunit beta [Anaeromyxobacteraceae bacterium]|nr:protocatechuate 3,4-dioxygenase subunit beta [Anaeromyxobacteraceae bacterium]